MLPEGVEKGGQGIVDAAVPVVYQELWAKPGGPQRLIAAQCVHRRLDLPRLNRELDRQAGRQPLLRGAPRWCGGQQCAVVGVQCPRRNLGGGPGGAQQAPEVARLVQAGALQASDKCPACPPQGSRVAAHGLRCLGSQAAKCATRGPHAALGSRTIRAKPDAAGLGGPVRVGGARAELPPYLQWLFPAAVPKCMAQCVLKHDAQAGRSSTRGRRSPHLRCQISPLSGAELLQLRLCQPQADRALRGVRQCGGGAHSGASCAQLSGGRRGRTRQRRARHSRWGTTGGSHCAHKNSVRGG